MKFRLSKKRVFGLYEKADRKIPPFLETSHASNGTIFLTMNEIHRVVRGLNGVRVEDVLGPEPVSVGEYWKAEHPGLELFYVRHMRRVDGSRDRKAAVIKACEWIRSASSSRGFVAVLLKTDLNKFLGIYFSAREMAALDKLDLMTPDFIRKSSERIKCVLINEQFMRVLRAHKFRRTGQRSPEEAKLLRERMVAIIPANGTISNKAVARALGITSYDATLHLNKLVYEGRIARVDRGEFSLHANTDRPSPEKSDPPEKRPLKMTASVEEVEDEDGRVVTEEDPGTGTELSAVPSEDVATLIRAMDRLVSHQIDMDRRRIAEREPAKVRFPVKPLLLGLVGGFVLTVNAVLFLSWSPF